MQPLVKIDPIAFRQCRRCNWQGPAYLESCRKCAAAMGDSFITRVAIITVQTEKDAPPEILSPSAILAIETSVSEWLVTVAHTANTLRILEEALSSLSRHALVIGLPSGVVLILYREQTFREAAEKAAETAAELQKRLGTPPLEVRTGIAHGFTTGKNAWHGSVASLAARLARAAQPGQTLTTYAIARELDEDWSFGPIGVLPRRAEDSIDRAVLLDGRKVPVPTPSALVGDDGAEIIGRHDELRLLQQELDNVVRNRKSSLCAVVAPAGGGKSKLLRYWLNHLPDEYVGIAGASGSPLGGQPLFVIRDLCQRLKEPLGPDTTPVHISLHLRNAIWKATRQDPLLLIIDDLHWTDESSLETVRLLSQECLDRCLVVLALRSSFLGSVPWIRSRARILELPALTATERETLTLRLLPEQRFECVITKIVDCPAAENPLFIEQCSAYIRETGDFTNFPRSLHAAVLKRLESLMRSVDRNRTHRLTPEQLHHTETKICEWLDRLETGDYESRTAIAEYLGLLQSIDSTIVILKAIAGVPQTRNRRLLNTIERFYSGTFSERAEAIEKLGRQNPGNAAYAAEAGAEQALCRLRIQDAIGYLKMAVRYSDGQEKLRWLMQLADTFFFAGAIDAARELYESAFTSKDLLTCARCSLRFGQIEAFRASWQDSKTWLEDARPNLPGHEKFVCDSLRAWVLANMRQWAEAESEIWRLKQEARDTDDQSQQKLRWLELTKLKIAIVRHQHSTVRKDASTCANSFVFDSGDLAEIANLLDIVRLLQSAFPEITSVEVTNEAERLDLLLSEACRRGAKTEKADCNRNDVLMVSHRKAGLPSHERCW